MKSWKAGERSVAEALKEWWGVNFFRSPESGGMATSRASSLPPSVVANMVGDVICDLRDPKLDPEVSFPFVVEVKTYAAIDLYALPRRGGFEAIPGSKPKDSNDLWLCWYQAKVEAIRGNRWPLLIFKEDRKQLYVGFSLYTSLGKNALERGLDVLVFHDLGIMSWERFTALFTRGVVSVIVTEAISRKELLPPAQWAEPPDPNMDTEGLLGRRR